MAAGEVDFGASLIEQGGDGPITAAVVFLIILAGLIVYGSGVHL
jgi:hypothetical protein